MVSWSPAVSNMVGPSSNFDWSCLLVRFPNQLAFGSQAGTLSSGTLLLLYPDQNYLSGTGISSETSESNWILNPIAWEDKKYQPRIWKVWTIENWCFCRISHIFEKHNNNAFQTVPLCPTKIIFDQWIFFWQFHLEKVLKSGFRDRGWVPSPNQESILPWSHLQGISPLGRIIYRF